VLDALGAVSGRRIASRSTGFPIELIPVLLHLVVKTEQRVLKFADSPGLCGAALRPLLLLAHGAVTATAVGCELGIGAAAVNVALASSHRMGLVEWRNNDLTLTEAGERLVRRIRLASDVLWLDLEQANGATLRTDAQALLANMGGGSPAGACP
jgi:hypothetical protein